MRLGLKVVTQNDGDFVDIILLYSSSKLTASHHTQFTSFITSSFISRRKSAVLKREAAQKSGRYRLEKDAHSCE